MQNEHIKKQPGGPRKPTKNIVLLALKGLNELVKTHIHIKFMTYEDQPKGAKNIP